VHYATTCRCDLSFGTGQRLSSRTLGPVAQRNRLRRITGITIWYTPSPSYRGPDSFTYSATVDGVKSTHAAPVDLRVHECRLMERGVRQALCACDAPADALLSQECFDALAATCGGGGGGGSGGGGATHQLPARLTVRVCEACSSTAVVPAQYGELAAQCLNELAKVSRHLGGAGYCADTYAMPLCRGDATDTYAGASYTLDVQQPYLLSNFGSIQSDVGTSSFSECSCLHRPWDCACASQ
jgi:hypothetical protein